MTKFATRIVSGAWKFATRVTGAWEFTTKESNNWKFHTRIVQSDIEGAVWILDEGVWNDDGVWIDGAIWKDYP